MNVRRYTVTEILVCEEIVFSNLVVVDLATAIWYSPVKVPTCFCSTTLMWYFIHDYTACFWCEYSNWCLDRIQCLSETLVHISLMLKVSVLSLCECLTTSTKHCTVLLLSEPHYVTWSLETYNLCTVYVQLMMLCVKQSIHFLNLYWFDAIAIKKNIFKNRECFGHWDLTPDYCFTVVPGNSESGCGTATDCFDMDMSLLVQIVTQCHHSAALCGDIWIPFLSPPKVIWTICSSFKTSNISRLY